MRLRSTLSTLLLLMALVACTAGEHRLMRPASDTRFPALSGDADRYAEHREAWTRREPIGVKGEVEATFEDPSLGADYLAHLARVQGLGEVSRDGYFETMWAALYGTQGDRFPIQVTMRFDRLFHSKATLDPARWTFVLEDDSGRQWKPLHVGDLRDGSVERGKLASTFRLWFKIDDDGKRPLIDGRTRELILHVRGNPGTALLRWKFKADNPSNG
ncbi:hypothetical protein D3C87_651030 [compost metagenome]